jgi:hypothetical protein
LSIVVSWSHTQFKRRSFFGAEMKMSPGRLPPPSAVCLFFAAPSGRLTAPIHGCPFLFCFAQRSKQPMITHNLPLWSDSLSFGQQISRRICLAISWHQVETGGVRNPAASNSRPLQTIYSSYQVASVLVGVRAAGIYGRARKRSAD